MTQRLDEPEAREILEELARTGPPTARVAALGSGVIHVRRSWDREEGFVSPKLPAFRCVTSVTSA